ncbi:MAG: hypothetical protein DAHOPDDO_00030 [Ignavibacteriaceae bacterium]|nr:hypothetical protein [Ignavibacteriaceae bacterium]
MTKQKIAIIGAGKLAYSIVSALIKSKYDIQIVVSKKLSSARVLSEKFKIPHCSNSIKNIPAEVNVFFLTVPDGEIKKAAEKLSKLKRDFSKSICIHFSGVENISVLNLLRKKGCAIGSIHIIRPFPSKNIVDIRNSPASIETENRQAKSFLLQMCKKLKLKPHSINSDEKVFHHLAAVHSSNFLVGNLFNAFSLITSGNNFPKNILRKTTQSALDNVFNLSPAKALSGPIDRGDIYTIEKHLDTLDAKIRKAKNKDKLKLIRKNYIVQSLNLLEVVKVKYGKLSEKHRKIEKLLKNKLY